MLLAHRQAAPKQALVLQDVDTKDAHCLGSEPVLADGKTIGITASGALGMRLERSLAVTYAAAEYAVQGRNGHISLRAASRRPQHAAADLMRTC